MLYVIHIRFLISPDGRRRICATNPTCSRSVFSNHHQDQCTHTISQRRQKQSSLQHFRSDYLHTLFLRKRRPASRHRTILGATQGACDATQPDSEKRIVKSMSAPRRNVVLPQSDTCHNRQALPASQGLQTLLLGHPPWRQHTASTK